MNTQPNYPRETALSGTGAKDLEIAVQAWGNRIFDRMESAEGPSIFSRKGFYGAMMDWAMRDERFKTQLFRFVDVLPMLTSSREVTRHLEEYLGGQEDMLSPALRLGLKAAGSASWLVGKGAKSQAAAMARQFMLGDDDREVAKTLRDLRDRGLRFTVDLLGETVVSEVEADEFVARYDHLIRFLSAEVARWPARPEDAQPAAGPPLNVSLKLSAFYSQIHPADPDTAAARIADRLRPLLRLARENRAFVNFDMESYALKDLTLRVYRQLFSEPEFKDGPASGIALQAYLKDCEMDLEDLEEWARSLRRRLTIRLVKGAYWDYETIVAQQRHWPVPVFGEKHQSDANFERLSLRLLERREVFAAAFATHNVRSIAHVIAQAERLGVARDHYEFQMLFGMAEPIKEALLELGFSVRDYCPVGDLLPGMAYFVRRLLENTSNEGFLANKFAKGASREVLLKNPATIPSALQPRESSAAVNPSFQNEPLTDYHLEPNRATMEAALQRLRRNLGRHYPLVINHQELKTTDWFPSLNPADQRQIIGYAAQGGVPEAEAALQAAKNAQPAWGRLAPQQRAEILERTAELMRRDKADLAALEVLEAGKNWGEADADVAEAIDFCGYYVHVMRSLAAPRRTQSVPGESNRQHWWPVGVGLVIAPWNFPLAILTGMTAAAIVTGNTVVMKPSDQTPVIGSRLMDLFVQAGLPAGVVNLLMGPGSKVAAHLVDHPGVDFIAFTGSKEVGLKIWEASGRTRPGQHRLRRVVCEMGGKNCIIVDSDADLDEAVAGCIASAFGYQGQKCSALSRLIVLQENSEKFMARLLAAAESLRIGPAVIPGNVLGPVINREAQERILKLIEQGRREARLVWQGKTPPEADACYVPPTIFADVPASSLLFREEIFGPVLAVSVAKDFDEALALANDSEFALTGGVYSRSPRNIERVKSELVCGNLYINRPITGALVERQPFGGFKMSGGGTKAGGPEYLLHFMVPRVITENCLRRGFAPTDEN